MSDARLNADAPLLALEQEFARLHSKLSEAGNADLNDALDAVCAAVRHLADHKALTVTGLNVKTRIAAQLKANGWDDLVELVARSVARDAIRLTALVT